MITYALDTNIVSHIIKGNSALSERVEQELANGNRIVIPPVVLYEIKRWLLFNNSGNRSEMFDALCGHLVLESMGVESFETAAAEHARLKRAGYNLDDADLLIAGFCTENEYVLVTNNVKHFELINGIEIVDWMI